MKKIMLFLAVACIMAACSNENEVLNEPQYITEFKAVFGGADSRVAATPTTNGLKFSWEDGDVVYVFSPNNDDEYTDYEYNSAAGKFEKVYPSDPGMTVGHTYFATTDNQISFTTVGEKPAVTTELYPEGVTEIPLISEIFTAQADGTIARMHHTVGVVEVPVKLGTGSTINEPVDVAIEVAGANVVGPFITTLDEPYFANATGDNENYTSSSAWQPATLDESDPDPVSFFIPMLPGTYTNPTLSFYNEEYTTQVAASVALTGTLTIECGKITKLPVQTLE